MRTDFCIPGQPLKRMTYHSWSFRIFDKKQYNATIGKAGCYLSAHGTMNKILTFSEFSIRREKAYMSAYLETREMLGDSGLKKVLLLVLVGKTGV